MATKYREYSFVDEKWNKKGPTPYQSRTNSIPSPHQLHFFHLRIGVEKIRS